MKSFIKTFSDIVFIYYGFNKVNKYHRNISNFINKRNLLNFITSIFFTEKIYSLLFNLQKKLFIENEVQFESNFLNFYHYEPQEFGVNIIFCLNQETIKYLEEQKLIDTKNKEILKKIKEITSEIPFKSSIDLLKNLNLHKSPFHKLKIIETACELIYKEIIHFYSELGIEIHLKTLNSNEIFSILMFILVKSKLSSILVHCNIIEKFFSKKLRKSSFGFYFECLKFVLVPFSLEKKLCLEEINYFKENKLKGNYKSIGELLGIRTLSQDKTIINWIR